MKETPLVSVIVPLYNKETWVKRCVESIVKQTYQHMEILIINDGSTDDSCNIVATIEDSRIKIIDKPNGGVSSARNLGIERAKGDYIAFIDADDRWELQHIALLMKGFEEYENAVMVANRLNERVSSDETDIEQDNALGTDCTYSMENYLLSLSKNLFSLHIGSSMFKKSVIDTYTIKFYEHIKIGEDVNFLIRISRLGECILSNYVGLIYYRDDENSAMNRGGQEAALVPLYFYGMDQEKWSTEEHKCIVKFLRREYIKKAYQNRRLPWRQEELTSEISGGVEIGKLTVLLYLTIRYTPEFIYSFYRQIK